MNKKVDDKWLKDLRERMDDYAEPLPEGLWEELEGELNQPKVIPFWRRWPSVAAAVALVLIINSLTLSYWLGPQNEEDIQLADQLVSEGQAVAVPEMRAAQVRMVAEVTEADGRVDASSFSTQREGVALYGMEMDAEEVSQLRSMRNQGNLESTDVSTDVSTDDSTDDSTAHSDKQTAEAAGYARYRSSARARSMAGDAYAVRRRKSEHGGFEIGLHTGGIPYSASKDFAGMSRMASHPTVNAKLPIVMGSVNAKVSPYNQVLFSNRDKHTSTQVKHRMPINVVASVKWHFADKWALESGLSYTFLQSDLHSGSDLYWEDTQKLHYVGIPIKIHRHLWGNAAVAFYASAGGMIEKCVSGSLESVYVTDDATREVEHHGVHEHPFQASLAAAVGGQVKVLNGLSLFVEPGVAYYFDDNSRLETIRKEHPFNFNLQFGLRFNLNK